MAEVIHDDMLWAEDESDLVQLASITEVSEAVRRILATLEGQDQYLLTSVGLGFSRESLAFHFRISPSEFDRRLRKARAAFRKAMHHSGYAPMLWEHAKDRPSR